MGDTGFSGKNEKHCFELLFGPPKKIPGSEAKNKVVVWQTLQLCFSGTTRLVCH
jgi:hypothetical protein